MTVEQTLGVLAVVVALLTAGVTALGGYLGYLTHTLEGRLRAEMDRRLVAERTRLDRGVAARLALLDAALEVMASGEVEKGRRDSLYLLRHVARLGSSDHEEIRKSLRALEGAGAQAEPLLAYVERLRVTSEWPNDCETAFEELLRAARDRQSKARTTAHAG